jgi:hypothetical protein
MENVGAKLRANMLCKLVWGTYKDIVGTCREAWLFLTKHPNKIKTIGTREWPTINQ